jgi:hypothetical protein
MGADEKDLTRFRIDQAWCTAVKFYVRRARHSSAHVRRRSMPGVDRLARVGLSWNQNQPKAAPSTADLGTQSCTCALSWISNYSRYIPSILELKKKKNKKKRKDSKQSSGEQRDFQY